MQLVPELDSECPNQIAPEALACLDRPNRTIPLHCDLRNIETIPNEPGRVRGHRFRESLITHLGNEYYEDE